MSETVFFQKVKFSDIKGAIVEILAEVDTGAFDDELTSAGVERESGKPIAEDATFSEPQGMSHLEWAELVVTFGPFARKVATDVWKIVVVPELKRRFRDENVSRDKPTKRKPSKKD